MTEATERLDPKSLDYAKSGGLVTVVTQDAITGAVLMVAHADAAALERTLATGEMHYHSRSRGPWHKGETSGHVQRVVSLAADCDRDAVLARVVPAGPACHTGAVTCFGDGRGADALGALAQVIAARAHSGDAARAPVATGDAAAAARASYTARLLGDRNLRLKKLGEEAAELVTACADGDRVRAIEEAADLVYHALVALQSVGAGWEDVQRALWQRGAGRAAERSA